jgi:N-acyl-D-aspartate/D-glutamate deacylase
MMDDLFDLVERSLDEQGCAIVAQSDHDPVARLAAHRMVMHGARYARSATGHQVRLRRHWRSDGTFWALIEVLAFTAEDPG